MFYSPPHFPPQFFCLPLCTLNVFPLQGVFFFFFVLSFPFAPLLCLLPGVPPLHPLVVSCSLPAPLALGSVLSPDACGRPRAQAGRGGAEARSQPDVRCESSLEIDAKLPLKLGFKKKNTERAACVMRKHVQPLVAFLHPHSHCPHRQASATDVRVFHFSDVSYQFSQQTRESGLSGVRWLESGWG